MPEDSSVTAASLSRGPIGPGIGRISLPKPLTSFIGRERELAQATRLLQGSYLVTLTGPGGSGKTRLCIAPSAIPLNAGSATLSSPPSAVAQ
jgi:hypothetical protein